VVAGFPLVLLGYGGLCLFWFCCFFLLVLAVRSNSRSPVWGVAGFRCCRQSALAGFKFIFSRFSKPDLRTSVDFCQTCATQLCSPSSSAPTARSFGFRCRRQSALAKFKFIFSQFSKPDLRTSVDFCQTCATQLCSPSSSAPTARSFGCVVHRRSARGLHVPESFYALTTREGHAPSF
jgi:hypothetical protein